MICLVIAMEKEALPVIENMTVISDKNAGNKRIVRGQLFNTETGVVICGVGKVNAASGTQYAIDVLKADQIINVGVAGGLNETCSVGEIYEIQSAVQYDFDLTQLNGGEIGTLDECKNNYLPLVSIGKYPKRKLATGDRFNDSPTDYILLTDVLQADIRDMEGGAVAQVCMHAKIPCCEFKIISDIAGSGSTTEQYLNNLSVCFETLKRELKNLIPDGPSAVIYKG